MLEDVHLILLKLGRSLGYFSETNLGVCHGMAIAWMSACLIDERDEFYKRIHLITKERYTSAVVLRITQAQEKVKLKIPISSNDYKYLEILAFYELIKIYQQPQLRTMLGHCYSQTQFIMVSPFVESDLMKQKGGMIEINLSMGMYTFDDIAIYLQQIVQAIRFSELPKKTTIGFILSSVTHALALTFNVIDNTWSMMDINQWPPETFITTQHNQLAQKIINAFQSKNTATVFQTQVIITGSLTQLAESPVKTLIAKLTNIKTTITQTMCGKLGIESVVRLATDAVDTDYINQLRNFKVDLSLSVLISTRYLACAIADDNSVPIKALISNGAELNYLFKSITPVFMAIHKDSLAVLNELCRLGADLNHVCIGETATSIAVLNNKIQALQLLAAYKADFNIAKVDGTTPAMIAAKLGFRDVLKILAINGADLNKADHHGRTAASLAAEHGHVHIINELILHKVTFTNGNDPALRPITIAVERGYLNLVKLMIKHVNLNEWMSVSNLRFGAYLLSKAAQSNHSEMVAYLLQWNKYNTYISRQEITTVCAKFLTQPVPLKNNTVQFPSFFYYKQASVLQSNNISINCKLKG